MFEHLLLPGKIGTLKLKNRMKFAAATTNYCGSNGEVTDREVAFLAERAKGGGAIVSSGGAFPHVLGKGYARQLGVHDDQLVPGLARLARSIRDSGAMAVCQIMHTGRFAQPKKCGINEIPVGPTAMASKLPLYSPCRELTSDEVRDLVESYGQAARRIKEAGFNAVDIACLGGYLPAGFLCRESNRRTDEYGGSLENRARFIVEILRRIRKEAGPDCPISVKLQAIDLVREGGNTEEEYIEIARMCEDAGADAFSLAVGSRESDFPAVSAEIRPGRWLYLAEKWKKAGIKVPLMMCYRLSRPEIADKAIADGVIDFWEMCRPLIADPYLPTKVAEGRPRDIAVCLADGNCRARLFTDEPIACTVNPRAGRELEEALQFKPASTKRRIVVVGGGPAGMVAAATASFRGHQVTLHEAADRLGGQLRLASVAPFKSEIGDLNDYLASRVQKAGVDVKLNSKVSTQAIRRARPQVVVLATGSIPVIPDIPGVDGGNVAGALEVLSGAKPVGDRAIVVGGGMIGCEVAEFLAEKGKKVTILEVRQQVGEDISPSDRWRVIERLHEAGVSMETAIEIKEITGTGVIAGRGGSTQLFAADTVVLAMGMKPDRALYEALKGNVPEVYVIGDCVESRTIGEAIEEGTRLGMTL